jgi:hypothetical protein
MAPSQPIVSYVGYSLKEPWGEPRVVIGIDADEAEYLADFLDRDECAQRGQVARQQIPLQQGVLAEQTAGDIAAELASWTSGELPGQATEKLNGWPPSAPAATEQPPAAT